MESAAALRRRHAPVTLPSLWATRRSGMLRGGRAATGRVPALARGRDSGRRACRGRALGGADRSDVTVAVLAELPERPVLLDRVQLQPSEQRRSGRVPGPGGPVAQPHVHRESVRRRRVDVCLTRRWRDQLRFRERLVCVLDADPVRRAERRRAVRRDRLLRESLARENRRATQGTDDGRGKLRGANPSGKGGRRVDLRRGRRHAALRHHPRLPRGPDAPAPGHVPELLGRPPPGQRRSQAAPEVRQTGTLPLVPPGRDAADHPDRALPAGARSARRSRRDASARTPTS